VTEGGAMRPAELSGVEPAELSEIAVEHEEFQVLLRLPPP